MLGVGFSLQDFRAKISGAMDPQHQDPLPAKHKVSKACPRRVQGPLILLSIPIPFLEKHHQHQHSASASLSSPASISLQPPQRSCCHRHQTLLVLHFHFCIARASIFAFSPFRPLTLARIPQNLSADQSSAYAVHNKRQRQPSDTKPRPSPTTS